MHNPSWSTPGVIAKKLTGKWEVRDRRHGALSGGLIEIELGMRGQ